MITQVAIVTGLPVAGVSPKGPSCVAMSGDGRAVVYMSGELLAYETPR